MVGLNNISVSFGATPLLKNISFVLNKGEKVALTGKNGAGKSTLLKIVAGLQSPTEGNVQVLNDATIGYLPQKMELSDDCTLLEETKKAFSEQFALNRELDDALKKLQEADAGNEDEHTRLLEKIDNLITRTSINSISDISMEMETTLHGLGFGKEDFNRPTSEFSGGWRMRIELAKILLRHPDVILLDEPTNHLDIESIQWLESFLKNKNITLIMVSHDRAFLDNVTSRTIEINCGKIYDYKVNYSKFEELRKERLAQQQRAYDNQQKEIADIKDFIARFRYKPTKAVQVQSRIKQLEKIVPIEIDEVDKSRIAINFPPVVRSGDFPIIVESLAKNYGDLKVIENVNLTLRRGEKVAFVGKNGEGKSTLVKCIMGEVGFEGDLKIGHNVTIGYFAQDATRHLDDKLTVFETIDNIAVGDIRTRIKDLLGAFLFRGADIDKKVSVLSGGERTRLALLKLILQPCNLLILDEPTNHLDMQTKQILKQALLKYDGTLILVSHDRDFLNDLVGKVYEFKNKKVREHLGGIYDYLASHNPDLKEVNRTESGKAQKAPKVHTSKTENPQEDSKISYQQQKELERKRKRLEKQIAEMEKEIQVHEEKLKELEDKLGQGLAGSDILIDYENTRGLLDKAMARWEELQLSLEN